MPKGNAFLAKRRQRRLLSPTLVSRSSGEEFTFRLLTLDGNLKLTAMDKGQELASRFVHGGELLPPVDDQPVFPSMSTCGIVGAILTAQTGEAVDRYNEFELFAMLCDEEPGWQEVEGGDPVRLPSLFEQLCDLADEVQSAEDGKDSSPLAPA